MANKEWISNVFKKHDDDERERNTREKVELQREQKFRGLLPHWQKQFESDIRDAINEFNAGLARLKRMHAVQLHQTPSGFELMAAEVPDYAINIDADAALLSYGFARSNNYHGSRGSGEMKLLLSSDLHRIEGRPTERSGGVEWFGPGSEAEMALRIYFEAALKQIT